MLLTSKQVLNYVGKDGQDTGYKDWACGGCWCPNVSVLVATACRFRRWVSTLLLKTARASRFSSWRSSLSSSRCFRTSSSGKCSSIEPNRSVLCRIIALRHRRLERSQITSLFRASRYSFCSFDFLASSVFCSMNSLLVSGISRSSTSFFSFLLKYNVRTSIWTLYIVLGVSSVNFPTSGPEERPRFAPVVWSSHRDGPEQRIT